MKTNFFKLTLMAFAATAFITGCSQNEEPDAPNQNKVLAVSTTIQDFTQESKSRIIDEPVSSGYETKFETGDQIGVYAIAEDGTMMCKNMPMTYSAAEKWESASPLYFYKNATYIAYSPYTAALSSETVTDIAAIKTYFTNTVLTDAMKSYSQSDLMTAEATTGSELPAANTSAITFNFMHAMSMVEFVIPVANYKTTAGYEYSGPIFGLKLKMKEGAQSAANIDNINALGKGVYRMLLAPVAANITDKDLTFSGELFVGDGTQPVYFETATAFRPTSGTYKKVNVTYTGSPDPTNVVDRDIAVGDYYYSDGGIVPGDASVIPTKNCIGVVYKVATDSDPINIGGKTQACVLGLTSVKTKWGRKGSILTTKGIASDIADAYTVIDGYVEHETNFGDITNTLNTYKSNNSAPETSTDWYIPSLRECAIAINNLSGTSLDMSTNPVSWTIDMATLQKKLNINKETTEYNEDNYKQNEWWWTVVEASADAIWGIHVRNNIEIANGRMKDQNQQNTSNAYTLRPVLAF